MNQSSFGSGYLKPFPHTIIDNFAAPELVSEINADWPDMWNKEDGKFTRKWHTSEIPESAKRLASSVSVEMLEEFTGITGLIADPELFGAGLHCIPPGGFLNMHCDFNVHPNGWVRRVNVLIYLNEVWKSEWGGQLQLGLDSDKILIEPNGGKCVIFETNDKTWHGHPDKLACPEDVQRRSMALYFYTKTEPESQPHSTIYKKRRKVKA